MAIEMPPSHTVTDIDYEELRRAVAEFGVTVEKARKGLELFAKYAAEAMKPLAKAMEDFSFKIEHTHVARTTDPAKTLSFDTQAPHLRVPTGPDLSY